MKTLTDGVTSPRGFQAGGAACGIKKNQQLDLAIIYSETPAVAAGIFTTNLVQAAPVIISKKHLQNDNTQVIIANSGNANACNGQAGMDAALVMVEAAAKTFGISGESVLVASTGVIGVPLAVAKIQTRLNEGREFVATTGGKTAAQAIMTTDTFPKEAAVEILLEGTPVRIGGMAKGSGMIHPNMATMLGFITTDAAIGKDLLQKAIAEAGNHSFNRISVDGDTSTNDCLLILANGKADNKPIAGTGPEYAAFQEALNFVCLELAKMIVRDGEGATKFVEIKVCGASTEPDALKVGKSVAGSNLVKTALFGADANWGRILAAVGYAGVALNPAFTDIYLDELQVCKGGMGLPFDEGEAKRILEKKEILITIDLNMGKSGASVWTSDLSYDYVKINGSYRT